MKVVDTLVGLQWGSEGKGKIAAYLSKEYQLMIRSGGPQAGHTFYKNNRKYINRQLPCGVFSNCKLLIAPAGVINLDILEKEIKEFQIKPSQLIIDKSAMVVTEKHITTEIKSSLKKRLASTCEGVGAAQVDKIWRTGVLFNEYTKGTYLQDFCKDTITEIQIHIKNNSAILIEGTQGFGLCLNHGEYPYVTSRNVTSSALLNDAGIAPKHHRETIGVMRTYPIRVGGNSGPTNSKEITWKDIQNLSNSPHEIKEFTTVTQRLRRVFKQDFETLNKAILVNKPDQLALMFIDYINHKDYGKTNFDDLSQASKDYIKLIEEKLKVPITLIGTGPREEHIIDRRSLPNNNIYN